MRWFVVWLVALWATSVLGMHKEAAEEAEHRHCAVGVLIIAPPVAEHGDADLAERKGGSR